MICAMTKIRSRMARGLIAVTTETRLAAAAISACALASSGLQQRAFGDVDEIAPVDDRARGLQTSRRLARAVSGRLS